MVTPGCLEEKNRSSNLRINGDGDARGFLAGGNRCMHLPVAMGPVEPEKCPFDSFHAKNGPYALITLHLLLQQWPMV